MGTSQDSNDGTAEPDENGPRTPENDVVTAENGEDSKTDDDKVAAMPPTSPTPTSLWRPKTGYSKRPPGFQGQLCCSCEMTGSNVPLCYLTMSSAFGM